MAIDSDPSLDSLSTTFQDGPGYDASAMDRRLQQNQSDPQLAITQGLQHLQNPNVNIPEQDRLGMAKKMLQAIHFGQGGMPQSIEAPQSKAKIEQPQQPQGGGLNIGQVASTIAELL